MGGGKGGFSGSRVRSWAPPGDGLFPGGGICHVRTHSRGCTSPRTWLSPAVTSLGDTDSGAGVELCGLWAPWPSLQTQGTWPAEAFPAPRPAALLACMARALLQSLACVWCSVPLGVALCLHVWLAATRRYSDMRPYFTCPGQGSCVLTLANGFSLRRSVETGGSSLFTFLLL